MCLISTSAGVVLQAPSSAAERRLSQPNALLHIVTWQGLKRLQQQQSAGSACFVVHTPTNSNVGSSCSSASVSKVQAHNILSLRL